MSADGAQHFGRGFRDPKMIAEIARVSKIGGVTRLPVTADRIGFDTPVLQEGKMQRPC